MNPESSPEQQPTQYASPRDQLLHHLCQAGWANQGMYTHERYVGRLSNPDTEIWEIAEAFNESMTALGVELHELIGDFLVVEQDSVVTVTEFGSAGELEAAFEDAIREGGSS